MPFRTNILVENPEGLAGFLDQRDIAIRRFFFPLHRQPSFNQGNSVVRQRPVYSVRLFETGIMLPSGLDLTDEQIDRVCQGVWEYQQAYVEAGRPGAEVA